MRKARNTHFQAFTVDTALMRQRMGDFGLRIATPDELRRGVTVTEDLLGAALAPEAVITRIQSQTDCTSWVCGEPVNGLFLIIPLTSSGVSAVRNGIFEPPNPDTDHICTKGELCSGVYVGVYAGETREARRSMMVSSAVLRVEMFGSVPIFARGASEDGVRSMKSLGFSEVIGGLPDLFVQEAA